MGCIPEVAFGSGEAEPGHMCLVMSDEDAVPTPNTGGGRFFVWARTCVSSASRAHPRMARVSTLSMRRIHTLPSTAEHAGLS